MQMESFCLVPGFPKRGFHHPGAPTGRTACKWSLFVWSRVSPKGDFTIPAPRQEGLHANGVFLFGSLVLLLGKAPRSDTLFHTMDDIMKKNLVVLISLLLVSGCSASPIHAPVSLQATWTPAPTYTFYPTYTPFPGKTSSPTVSGPTTDAVVAAFKAAGLEAENSRPMAKDDYGMAPTVCQGTRFFIPSLGPDNGGRIFICDNPSFQAAMAGYYQALGSSDAKLFSWVFEKGHILVQINGQLPSAAAHKYEAAIP